MNKNMNLSNVATVMWEVVYLFEVQSKTFIGSSVTIILYLIQMKMVI